MVTLHLKMFSRVAQNLKAQVLFDTDFTEYTCLRLIQLMESGKWSNHNPGLSILDEYWSG